MGSKVYLIDHLTADELYHRYREEQDPIKRTYLQILWLLTSGRPAKVAFEMTTGSDTQHSSIGGQLSSKSLTMGAFTRRWYEPHQTIMACTAGGRGHILEPWRAVIQVSALMSKGFGRQFIRLKIKDDVTF